MDTHSNKTGARSSSARTSAMLDSEDLPTTAPDRSGTSASDLRGPAIALEEPIGSLVSDGAAVDPGLACLLDKLGARLAFERGGVRLYEAILRKAEMARGEEEGEAELIDDLLHIRDEEAEHADLLQRVIVELDGDPTVETPCADLEGVMSSGLVQVVNDPRATVAQCLRAAMVAELADDESWTSLIAQADGWVSEDTLADLRGAEDEEQEHLTMVRRHLQQAEDDFERRLESRDQP
jgi:bacterioferritin (cytochrome b1)